jgi:hypothetical protein
MLTEKFYSIHKAVVLKVIAPKQEIAANRKYAQSAALISYLKKQKLDGLRVLGYKLLIEKSINLTHFDLYLMKD